MQTLSVLTLLLRLVISLTASLFASSASAHTASTSSVFINMDSTTIEADIYLPLDQLLIAEPALFSSPELELSSLTLPALKNYMQTHVNLSSNDGQTLQNQMSDELELSKADGVVFLTLHMQFDRPDTSDNSPLTLHYNAILHRVVTHKIYVSLSHDAKQVLQATQDVATLGIIRYQHEQLLIEQTKINYWSQFKLMFTNGMQHIASGIDHLLFLFCLLLPAPLLSKNRRWQSSVPLRQCMMSVVKIVSCFTLGHSLTLALATLGYSNLPVKPIEILVAASILISAAHAIRPVFGQTAGLIALGFGLIHGLAFATEMRHMGFDSHAVVLALIAFNLGIETVQLMIVLAVMPLLALFATTRFYSGFRMTSSLTAMAAACFWIVQRSF